MKKEILNQNLKTIVIIFFVITGATGLIYQIVWFKYLGLFLGNTTYAQMIVLSTFLGGLAIGNYVFGKKADNFKNPLRYYALFELTIGIYCLLYPTLSFFFGDLFINVASYFNIDGRNLLFNLFRLVLSSVLLIIPAIAMGGTFPVLSKFYISDIENTRRDVAILYFLNSFGAVWGIILAGFQLIKLVGLNVTIYSAAVVNIIIGVAVLFLSRSVSATAGPSIEAVVDTPDEIYTTTNKTSLLSVTIVAGLSGMAALLYEMVWTRLFINIFGSSTYAFSIMLLVFISGITLGGFIISQKIFARYDKIKLIIIFQSLIAFSTMFVLTLYERLPFLFWKISSLIVKNAATFNIFLTLEFIICFTILFVPTLLMGMTLPVITEVVAHQNKKIGISVGKVFAINTFGTVVGVLLTGLVFIPLFGIKGSFEIGILLNIGAAILVIVSYEKFTEKKKILYSSTCAVLLFLYILLIPQWNVYASLYGVFKALHSEPPETYEEYLSSREKFNVLYYKEGINANVAVTETLVPPRQKRLIINGKPDASSITDMPTQILLGQIPMMLHSNPKEVFVVGFGIGVTIGSVLLHPVEKVECAEISSEVIEAGVFFNIENYNCIADPRLKIYNEDALTLLKLSKEKYDVIISEPSNPWIAGIGNLFSEEYFELCKSKLDSNGIMVQWFHLYESEDEVVKLVLNTFSSVFPDCQVWSGVANDIIIVGSKNGFVFDYNLLLDKLNNDNIKRDFGKIGIDNIFTFLTCQSLTPRSVFIITDNKPINSELHPLLEFSAPRSFYIGSTSGLIYKYDERFDTLDNQLIVYDYIKHFIPSTAELISTAYYHYNTTRNLRFSYGLLMQVLDKGNTGYDTQMLYANVYNELQIDNPKKYYFEKMLRTFPDSTELLYSYLNMKVLERINATNFLYISSIRDLSDKFISLFKRDPVRKAGLYIQLASNYLLNSELEHTRELCERTAKLIEENPDIVNQLPLDEFYYTYAIAGYYLDIPEITFEYYYKLVNQNSSFDKLPILRKLVAWRFRGNEVSIIEK